ncbi:uncharacterized protein V6R79_022875 [Siganus canaliculatus]
MIMKDEALLSAFLKALANYSFNILVATYFSKSSPGVYFKNKRSFSAEFLRALKDLKKIREEFYRITNKNLMDNFKEALHQHTWRLLRLYRARRTAFSSEMNQILNSLDQETSDIAHRQTAALKGLPLYLRDSQEKLFRNCLGDLDFEGVGSCHGELRQGLTKERSVSASF